MLINLNNAILHIVDFASGVIIPSEIELDKNDDSVLRYITKHAEKIINSATSNTGNFHEQSSFLKQVIKYKEEKIDFSSLSNYILGKLQEVTAGAELMEATDLIIADISADGERHVLILKCNNKTGFTHFVNREGDKIKNELISHYAILPNLSQKIDEYALIALESLDIKFSDRKRFVNGTDVFLIPEKLLECCSKSSPKNTIDIVEKIAQTVSDNYGKNSVETVSKVKNLLVENAEISDYVEPIEIGKEIFSESPLMQNEYVKEVEKKGVYGIVKIDREYAIKRNRNHKIKTDTGIELAFPVDYFQNKDFIEFFNKPDGTISIELKNIGKITNR